MKNLTFLLLLSLPFMTSCNDDTRQKELSNLTNCPFEVNENNDGIIDDNEKAIMDDCFENAITNQAELEMNVIGEWDLIGHGEGWFTSVSMPCSKITITESALTLEIKNERVDTTTTHTWEAKFGLSSYYLEVTPSMIEGIDLQNICEEYMYGNATPADGNMYLYQKVN